MPSNNPGVPVEQKVAPGSILLSWIEFISLATEIGTRCLDFFGWRRGPDRKAEFWYLPSPQRPKVFVRRSRNSEFPYDDRRETRERSESAAAAAVRPARAPIRFAR